MENNMIKTMTARTNYQIGIKVRIDIKKPEGYTNDLYNSIQGKTGIIIQRQSDGLSTYNDAYIVKFGNDALKKYQKTHSGKWSHAHRMEWWTESKDFIVVN